MLADYAAFIEVVCASGVFGLIISSYLNCLLDLILNALTNKTTSTRTTRSPRPHRLVFHIRHLRQVRRVLGHQVAAQLVSALVISHLDYGNGTLAGLP